jgi:PAS domain S-box-containing protein
MLSDICQVMVDVGGYAAAWIGFSEDDPAKAARPFERVAGTAEYGEDRGVVSTDSCIKLDIKRGGELIGAVIRARRTIVAHDTDIRSGDQAWPRHAHGADCRSFVTLPLWADNNVFAGWVICSDQPDAFDQQELDVLTGLANDLAFGIVAQRNKSARAQLAAIVESAADAIVGRGLDGTITSWNNAAERLFGYGAGEIIGQPMAALVPCELAGESNRLFRKVQCGETVEQFDTIRLAKDGRRIDVSLRLSLVRNDAGDIVAAAVFLRDCTARKNAEQALRFQEAQRELLTRNLAAARDQAEEASQAKSRFLAGITHELRTPLHGMLGYAELLNLEGGLNPTQSKRLEAMMAAGHYLLDTINAVLDMSQIEADRLELHPVEIELLGLVRTCLDVVRPAADAKGLALVLAPASPLRLFSDPTRLRQVLLNLLGNAVKFTLAGSVEVRLLPIDARDGVRLEVADTGPGILARHRARLFQTFERLNAQAVSGIEGAGLGLAIAAHLVRLMGGRIGYADNQGGGSVFWVELPCATVSATEVEAAAPPRAARSRLRVLVVDDEALNRDIARGFLGLAGHEVVCVDNGAAAVAAAAAGDFDVILMDVRMPGMNGLRATRLIRALPAPRGEVRIVAVTAQAFAQQIATCLQAGMDGHIAKPFNQAVLLATLQNPTTVPNDTELAATSPATACAEAGTGLPMLDRAMFEDIVGSLSAADLDQNLRLLITGCEALLCALRRPGLRSRASEVAEAAHKLAGGAGTFGFLAMAAAARQFEVAADMGTHETVALGANLAAAIEASTILVQTELTAMAATTL